MYHTARTHKNKQHADYEDNNMRTPPATQPPKQRIYLKTKPQLQQPTKFDPATRHANSKD